MEITRCISTTLLNSITVHRCDLNASTFHGYFPRIAFRSRAMRGFSEQLANCGLAQANSRPRHAPSKVAGPASTLTTFDYRSASAHARKKIHRISTSSTIKHNHLSSCHEKKTPSITTTKQSRNLLCNGANAKLKFALRRRP